MRNSNDFVEVEPGYFIEYHKYQTLLDIGVLPWEMRAYITRKASSYRAFSSAGKPLAFQKKLVEGKI